MRAQMPIQLPKWDASPMHIAAWLAILIWVLATLFLADYYLTNNNFDNFATFSLNGTTKLSGDQVKELGLGLAPLSPSASTSGLAHVLAVRRMQKTGDFAGLAAAGTELDKYVQASGSESYKMMFASLQACALKGCSNRVYLLTAGQLASLDVRSAGHAMMVEALYWYSAVQNGDMGAAANAVARLDVLVREHGSADLRLRWQALQDCRGTCSVFEEELLDFIEAANQN